MPQMMPMKWFNLMITFTLIFMLIMSMFFFFYYPILSNYKNIKSLINWSWKW